MTPENSSADKPVAGSFQTARNADDLKSKLLLLQKGMKREAAEKIFGPPDQVFTLNKKATQTQSNDVLVIYAIRTTYPLDMTSFGSNTGDIGVELFFDGSGALFWAKGANIPGAKEIGGPEH